MYFLFVDQYLTRRTYTTSLENVVNTILKFKNSKYCQSLDYDEERLEFFIQAKRYSIVVEVERIGKEITLDLTCYSSLRMNMPKTYAQGFIGFIEHNL